MKSLPSHSDLDGGTLPTDAGVAQSVQATEYGGVDDGCPHGCEDGFLIDVESNTANTCSCRAPRARARRAAALTDRKRAQCRRAGRASGRRRRQLARARRGNARPGQLTAELSYEHRHPSRREFDVRYEQLWPVPETPQGAAQWLRGRETAWAHLVSSYRLVCARGQYCATTKPRRAAALSSRGRPRCPRTVRRLNQKLEAMGYVAFLHRRAPLGKKDYLVCDWRLHRRLRPLDVTHPSGTGNYGPSAHVVPRCTPPSEAVPPDGGDQRQAPSAPVTEENRGTVVAATVDGARVAVRRRGRSAALGALQPTHTN